MTEFDFDVSSDAAVLSLSHEHLALDSMIHLHNQSNKIAKQIFIKLPNPHSTSAIINWYGAIDLIGAEAELLVLFSSTTYIHNANFKGFKAVWLSDHKIKEQNYKEAIIDASSHNKTTLTACNLHAKEIYISCSALSLLGEGNVTSVLAINAHGDNPIVSLKGGSTYNSYLRVGTLAITTPINQLSLDQIVLKDSFKHNQIGQLEVKNSIVSGDWYLENIGSISDLSLKTIARDTQIFTDKITITSLSALAGKFYIAAKSYIDFRVGDHKELEGVDLVLDMSRSNAPNKKVLFPNHKFKFDHIKVIGADEVSIILGGYCKVLIFEDCKKVVADNILGQNLKYNFKGKNGYLECSGKFTEHILVTGEVSVLLNSISARNIETNGLCNVNIRGLSQIHTLLVNLNLDSANPSGYIEANKSTVTLGHVGNGLIEIEQIFAKLSTFDIKGQAKLGTVLIQTIDNITTLLWVHLDGFTKLTLDRLYIADNYELMVRSDGCIELVRKERMLACSDIYASVSSSPDKSNNAPTYFYIKAGKGIRFQGQVTEVDDIGLFARYGDIFVKGFLQAHNNLSLIAQHGAVNVTGAVLDAKSITVYNQTANFITEALIKAENLVLYSLDGLMQIDHSTLKACNVAIVTNGEVNVSNSKISSNSHVLRGSNISISNSEIITYDIFVQSIHDFLLVHSTIHLVQYKHVLFASSKSENNPLIQGGFQLSCDVSLVGIFSTNQNNPLPKLQWQCIDFASNVALEQGKAYIDANRGFIIGSTISSQDLVIIKTNHSLEVVPLVLYNELMNAGGFNEVAIKEVASKINAGVIDIDAGKAATFVKALFKATNGRVKADVMHLLASSAEIATQQVRVKELVDFIGVHPIYAERINVGRYFDFTGSTSIIQRVGNLGIYDNYSSKELAFTQVGNDIVLERSIYSKYDKLCLSAEGGKILIISKNLQNIYQGNGGGEQGKEAAYASRTVIGGKDVYLKADEVISHAGKFEITGTLKIITTNGVHLLPVAVHERLMYHLGNKTTISEYIVRQVISEINAGYLDIKAGGALEAVSSLIKATGIKLEVNELKLSAEHEIFEKHVHFVGKENWHGGQQEWSDYTSNLMIQPTVIQADKFTAHVNAATTVEAAQILVKEESAIHSSGDLHFLPKYNIHVHDHTSNKSYLFNFHKGKLNIAGTKTVREHFYAEGPVPTLYYSKGSFFCYSEGKIHLLGGKIIGNDIHLVGQKGIKLEAVPYHEHKLVSISQNGFRIGYNVGAGDEVSVSSELFKNISKQQYDKQLYEASEIIARGNLKIESKNGNLEIISSKLKFNKATIIVRGLHFYTHHETTSEKNTTIQSSIGISAEIQESISGKISTAGYWLNKNSTSWLDILDKVVNLYKLGTDSKQMIDDIKKLTASSTPQELAKNIIELNPVRFKIWAAAKTSEVSTSSTKAIAVDNYLTGDDVDILVDGDAIIEGIVCEVNNFKFKAKSATVKASYDILASDTSSCDMEITIPILGNSTGGIGLKTKELSNQNTHYHSNNIITAKGHLEMTLEGNAKISGVRFIASGVMVRAKNMVLESLQDVIQERMRGLELNVNTNLAGAMQSLSGTTATDSRDARWTNAIGSIIGTQVTNVVVQQTLEIAGGLIANAEVKVDGSLTDKGKAYVEAGTIIAQQLHDYDNGKTFSLGATLTKKTNNNGNLAWGVEMPVACSFNGASRDIMPVIGGGNLGVTVSDIPATLSQDTGSHIGISASQKIELKTSVSVNDLAQFVQDRIMNITKDFAAIDSAEIIGKEEKRNSSETNQDAVDEYEDLPELHDSTDNNATDKNYNQQKSSITGKKEQAKEKKAVEINYFTLVTLAKKQQKQIELSTKTVSLLNTVFQSIKK